MWLPIKGEIDTVVRVHGSVGEHYQGKPSLSKGRFELLQRCTPAWIGLEGKGTDTAGTFTVEFMERIGQVSLGCGRGSGDR